MRWYNKIKLTMRMYSERIFVTLLLFAMSVVAFYTMDKVCTDYISANYAIWMSENQIGCNPNEMFYVQLYGGSNSVENAKLIRAFLREHPDMQGAGFCETSAMSSISSVVDSGVAYCPTILCDYDIVALGNLKLDKEEVKKYYEKYEGCKPVFLGSNLKGKVDQDERLLVDGNNFPEIEVYVACFLEEGAAWPPREGLFQGTYGKEDKYTLDELAIAVVEDVSDYYNDIMGVFGYSKDGKYDTVQRDLIRFAVENDINIYVQNYGQQIEEEREKSSLTEDDTLIAAILLAVLVVVAITAATIIYCMMNKYQYGVMLANGITKGNIIWMIVVQNAITVGLAAVTAWYVRNREVFDMHDRSKAEMIQQLERSYGQLSIAHDYYMPIILGIAVIIILVVSSIIPVYILKKQTIPELFSTKN